MCGFNPLKIISGIVEHPLKALPMIAANVVAPGVGSALSSALDIAPAIGEAATGALAGGLTGGGVPGAIMGGIGGGLSGSGVLGGDLGQNEVNFVNKNLGTNIPGGSLDAGGAIPGLDTSVPSNPADMAYPGASDNFGMTNPSISGLNEYGAPTAGAAIPGLNTGAPSSFNDMLGSLTSAPPASTGAIPGLNTNVPENPAVSGVGPQGQNIAAPTTPGSPAAAPGSPASAAAAKSQGGVWDWLKNHALSAGGLALSAMAKPNIPQLGNLEAAASKVANSGEALMGAVNGHLMPGGQTLVNTALQDAQTAIRSKYASMGLSGSSMEQQDLAAADQRAKAMQFQLESQQIGQGLNAYQLAGTLYANIAGLQLKQDQGLQNALGNFAAATAQGEAAAGK